MIKEVRDIHLGSMLLDSFFKFYKDNFSSSCEGVFGLGVYYDNYKAQRFYNRYGCKYFVGGKETDISKLCKLNPGEEYEFEPDYRCANAYFDNQAIYNAVLKETKPMTLNQFYTKKFGKLFYSDVTDERNL